MTRPLSDKPAAVRMRRHRERGLLGIAYVAGEVPSQIINDLLDAGAIKMKEIDNPDAVWRVILDAVAQWTDDAKRVRNGRDQKSAGSAMPARCGREPVDRG